MTITVKYPHINIPLVGQDGNAYAILARVKRIMRRADLPDSEWDLFLTEATSSNYDHLLLTVMSWFSVDEQDDDQDDEW